MSIAPQHPQIPAVAQPAAAAAGGSEERARIMQVPMGPPAGQAARDASLEAGGGGGGEAGGAGGDEDEDLNNEDSVSGLLGQILGQNPELRSTLALLERYIPCVILVLFKLIFDHGTGEDFSLVLSSITNISLQASSCSSA